MNNKELTKELLNKGFSLTEYKNFQKTFNHLNIDVVIYKSIFGKIKSVLFMYKFKNTLVETLHDEF